MPDAPHTRDAALVVHMWMEQDEPTLRGRLLVPQPVDRDAAWGVAALCEIVCAALRTLEDELAAEHRRRRVERAAEGVLDR
jgi:hypothetical protein